MQVHSIIKLSKKGDDFVCKTTDMNGDIVQTTFTPFRKNNPVPKKNSIITIKGLENLIPFKNNPFTLYEGQRFEDMVESIRRGGIIAPIIVRPTNEEGKYEILSGHNRVEAAKKAGLDSISAIAKEGLSEEEALLIVTETNLIQRSFADLKHSERAIVITNHYEAMKKKAGYRSDLIEEVENILNAPLGHRINTREKLGKQLSLGKTTIARYLRLNKLVPSLKQRLDKNEIGMRVGESLSFLNTQEQEMIEEVLANGKKISISQANKIKEKSQNSELTKTSINEILEPQRSNLSIKPIKLNSQFLSKYFKPEQDINEIEETINSALEMYFLSKKNVE